MIALLSPAKTLDYETALPTKRATTPQFLDEAEELVEGLREMSPDDISALMGVSEKIALENFERFQSWQRPFTKKNARAALFAFKGDVYVGLDAYSFDDDDLAYAQDHLRILSGLYGLLRPLDLVQPYRLEMGTRYGAGKADTLYQFWGDELVRKLNKELAKADSDTIINLASQEYFRALPEKQLGAEVITPVFKEWRKDRFKVISFSAKKARGRMSAYMIRERLNDPEGLKNFDWDGYQFSAELSSASDWVFTRDQP